MDWFTEAGCPQTAAGKEVFKERSLSSLQKQPSRLPEKKIIGCVQKSEALVSPLGIEPRTLRCLRIHYSRMLYQLSYREAQRALH